MIPAYIEPAIPAVVGVCLSVPATREVVRVIRRGGAWRELVAPLALFYLITLACIGATVRAALEGTP